VKPTADGVNDAETYGRNIKLYFMCQMCIHWCLEKIIFFKMHKKTHVKIKTDVFVLPSP
jgi:hypothetical protein